MATFITSKSVGEDIYISVQTSTEYWKYNHNGSDSRVFGNGSQTITVANANGEFTIIPCLSDGTVSGNITYLHLPNNQLTSFDGTGLTSLTNLNLKQNQLTSFDPTDLTSLTNLNLSNNQLTSFDPTDLTSLTHLFLSQNQLTSFDVTGLTSLIILYLNDNLLTPSSNNQILNILDQYGLENGEFLTTGGRTSAGTADYDALSAKGWTLSGLDLPPTFITAQSIGQDINIDAQTSTGYWKYNHNESDSSVFSNGSQTITVANANGEFSIIPCLSNGTPSGDITYLHLSDNQLTSFDGTDLTGLTTLYLQDNQLTSFDGTGLTSLITLGLKGNQLTSLDVSPMVSLQNLFLVDPYGTLTNPMTAASNNSILSQLDDNGVENGTFFTINGRTSDGTADYDALVGKGWNLLGLDLTGGNGGINITGKLRIKGATTIG